MNISQKLILQLIRYEFTSQSVDEDLLSAIDEFTKEAIRAGREYASYQMNQCIAVSLSGISLFNELKKIFVFACLAYVAAILHSVSRKFPKF